MIKLQNKELKDVAEFLKKLSLNGKKSVHRMRVVKVLEEQNKKLGEEELELLKEYVETDEKGEFVHESGNLKFKGDVKEFKKQQEDLYNEYFVLDDTNLESALKTLKEVVNDYNKELSEKDAEAHFTLVEAFENEANKEKNRNSM
jgi:acetolactate synthase small subunit